MSHIAIQNNCIEKINWSDISETTSGISECDSYHGFKDGIDFGKCCFGTVILYSAKRTA